MKMGESSGFEWAMRDLLIALLVVYMAMAAFALMAATKIEHAGVTQGNIVITLAWPGAPDADVDLWVRAPGDAPVGFSHPAGKYCNLLRDDLGHPLDPQSTDQEMVVCRGLPDGEFVVNAVLYAAHGAAVPVSATATAYLMSPSGSDEIDARAVTLAREGDEGTAFRFTLKDKSVAAMNELPAVLWGGQ